ncbi:MAG: DUF5684 domain-containing protein [Leucobacter sp.]
MTDYNDALNELFTGTYGFFVLVYYVLWVIAAWKVFSKAGYLGILALVPIVNLIIWVKIAGYSGWLVLLYLIPIVNFIFSIMVALRVGKNFGKGGAFSFFLLWLIPFIGNFVIGFGQAQYSRRA